MLLGGRCTSAHFRKIISRHFFGHTKHVEKNSVKSSAITDMHRSEIGLLRVGHEVVLKGRTARVTGEILNIMAGRLTSMNISQVVGRMW